jgi:hypothetical protein
VNNMTMRKILFLLALLAAAAASAAKSDPAAKPNQLTAAERKQGWQLLFDGKTTDAWRGYKKPDMAGLRWQAKDDCLGVPPDQGRDTKGALDIVSRKQYQDFELTWQWRITPGGNSGLKYLVTEDNAAALGHEYQMIDDDRHADAGKRDGRRRTGAFYDVLAAPAARPRPVGELNDSRLLVRGTTVEHWLNGAKILSYTLDSDDVRKAIADSKFKDVAGFDKPRRAHLLLQDHGAGICFRNLKIRELAPGK